MRLKFLGGADEVGRSSILLEGSIKCLLDYGIDVQNFAVPIHPDMPIDAVLLSHCHLDHSGMIPELYKSGFEGSVYATITTHDLSSLLLRDALKVQSRRDVTPFYLIDHIIKMEKKRKVVGFGERIELDSFSFEFHSAGHIPGSAAMVIEMEGKRILYTGDIKFIDTKLMKGAFADYKDIDILISESTYSYTNHPDRKDLERSLLEIVEETLHNNGIVLLPSFAVGRAQELLLIVDEIDYPVYMDGMGIDATLRILSHPESVRDFKALKRSFSKAHKVERNSQRKKIIRNPCVIITTAGMLNGGPIGYYMKRLHMKENCSLVLTGFQVPGTVGRTLLDTGRYVAEGLDVKPKMRVEFMDFSAHTDHDHLLDFYRKVNPEKIILVHGDHTEEFAEELKNLGFEVFSPKNGDVIEF